MSIGSFTDKNNKPTETEVLKTIGRALPAWTRINTYINTTFKAKAEYKFYGKNYGWALRYIKSGKSFIALYPVENKFTAQIILNKKQIEQAQKLELKQKIKNLIQSTPEIHEGKWLYIEVTTENELFDLEKLLMIRGNT